MSEIKDSQLEAYRAGKAELKDLLEIGPEYLAALKGRAQFFVSGGHTERALLMLEMLEELDRTDPTPSLIAASLFVADGRSDRAEEKIEAVLARLPNHSDAEVAKAELKIAIGELVPAAALLRSVIARDPKGATEAGRRALAVAAAAQARFERG
ncbi:MAG: hypothetical protein HY903_23205 [Deltaproteobacteria bacterium]|nr:hypothetical protein [Deltaproteobacteria bacterium]